jgi:hypothetical protein
MEIQMILKILIFLLVQNVFQNSNLKRLEYSHWKGP